MADVITGNTQVGATKNDVIIAIVQKELAFAAKMLPYVTDFSQFALPGQKTVKVPKLTSFTIVDRATATAGDASVLTSSVDTIDLDFNAYCAWLVDSADEIQSSIQWQIESARRAAAAHGRYVDEQILVEMEATGDAIATVSPLITRDVALEMRKKLQKVNGDLTQSAWIISPDQEEALLKINDFSQAQIFGQAVIPSGVIGSLYGMPVVIHNGLATAQYFLLERSGLGFAMQKAPGMSEQMANQYGTTAMRVAMDQLFGVQGMQLGVNGAAVGESPLIIKDANA